jgi:hypothetical protein
MEIRKTGNTHSGGRQPMTRCRGQILNRRCNSAKDGVRAFMCHGGYDALSHHLACASGYGATGSSSADINACKHKQSYPAFRATEAPIAFFVTKWELDGPSRRR